YDKQSTVYKETLGYMNIGFTSMFTIECILKIVAFGVRVRNTITSTTTATYTLISISIHNKRNFFKDPWNTFDFITVIGSIIDALVIELGDCNPEKKNNKGGLKCN
ncbi:hypothetical protein L9F63_015418, partial [Diploptera punctata]